MPDNRHFSNDEDWYLSLGVLEFGVGHWAEIRDVYGHHMKNRTNVSLKDRWRWLVKHGFARMLLDRAQKITSGSGGCGAGRCSGCGRQRVTDGYETV